MVLTISSSLCTLHAQLPFTSFDSVKENAMNEEKSMLVLFSGSDWCKPCIAFKKTILDAKLTQDFLNDHCLVHIVDFPYRKANQLSEQQQKENEAIAAQFNPEGSFPHIVILSSDKKRQTVIEYDRNDTPELFIHKLKKILAL